MSREFFQKATQKAEQIAQGVQDIFNPPLPEPIPVPSGVKVPDPLPAPSDMKFPEPRPDDLDPIKKAEQAAEEQAPEQDPECTTGKCCQLVSEEMLRAVWPKGNAGRIKIVADGLNININDGKIDSELRITHFIAQARHETGPSLAFRENLNYSENGLFKSQFSYYKGKIERCKRDAYNEEAIANNAYADINRSPGYRLGNTQPGDGWRYRGRGLKQLTGRDNYKNFTRDHEAIWGEKVDFVSNPDLVDQPLYAVRSGLAFWVRKKLYTKADGGASDAVTDSITKVINQGLFNSEKSIKNQVVPRRENVREIYDQRVFKDVCFNTSASLSNSKAREPK